MAQISVIRWAELSSARAPQSYSAQATRTRRTLRRCRARRLASLYLRSDGSASTSLYVKESQGVDSAGNPTQGTWTPK